MLSAHSLSKLWPSAQTENSLEEPLSPPGIEDLIAPVANCRASTQESGKSNTSDIFFLETYQSIF